ncbi:MAG: 7-carboxy-7-deazaguanine synthase QueE [Candidatus Aminicenantes bacterium]|nr:7-carboxy-7-deazaguanine synthase QueE [Candidatus Aminicenantes bacterium]
MPPQPILRIAEIFAGVQGEGLRLGRPTIFIRLSGCNLRCPFCDTKNAWQGGRPMSVAAIGTRVKSLRGRRPGDWICLTGGEPLDQDIGPLVERLHRSGFRIQVETNGTIPSDAAIDWVTVSPKPPGYEVAPIFRETAREVKLVVSRELTPSVIRRIRSGFPAAVPIFLQPESNRPKSRLRAVRLFNRTVREGLSDIRLGIQLHKVYGLP